MMCSYADDQIYAVFFSVLRLMWVKNAQLSQQFSLKVAFLQKLPSRDPTTPQTGLRLEDYGYFRPVYHL